MSNTLTALEQLKISAFRQQFVRSFAHEKVHFCHPTERSSQDIDLSDHQRPRDWRGPRFSKMRKTNDRGVRWLSHPQRWLGSPARFL